MDVFSLASPLIEKSIEGLSAGRMIESMVILTIVWRKLKPELKKFDDRLAGLATVVETGFKSGESRFQKIEDRLLILETTPTEGIHHGNTST